MSVNFIAASSHSKNKDFTVKLNCILVKAAVKNYLLECPKSENDPNTEQKEYKLIDIARINYTSWLLIHIADIYSYIS